MASHSDTTGIIDTDSRFVIDIVTGKIENHSDKESLRQYSHNSERFSFEMPRHVEGHDMTNCTKVTVNYLAADIPGEYEVDDLADVYKRQVYIGYDSFLFVRRRC